MDAASAGAEVVHQVAAAARAAARPLRLIGLLGAVVAFFFVVSLLPWLLHETWAVVLLVVLALVAFAGPVRLLWHARQLRTRLGDERWVLDELGEVSRESTEAVKGVLGAEGDGRVGPRSARGALRSLRHAVDGLGVAGHAGNLYLPVSPSALVLSGLAAIEVLGLVLVAPVTGLVAVVALAVR